jgi:hypothetical protein
MNTVASPSEQINLSKGERLRAFVRRIYPGLKGWKSRKEIIVEIRWERLECGVISSKAVNVYNMYSIG